MGKLLLGISGRVELGEVLTLAAMPPGTRAVADTPVFTGRTNKATRSPLRKTKAPDATVVAQEW